jgi:hypothetical protein
MSMPLSTPTVRPLLKTILVLLPQLWRRFANQELGGEKTRTAKLSYFGRLSYDYANKYFAQFSLRADAADLALLPQNTRWGYFPAASIGWTVSEENFFEPLHQTINSLKLRASWGQNGSLSALSGYSYSTDMTQAGSLPLHQRHQLCAWS